MPTVRGSITVCWMKGRRQPVSRWEQRETTEDLLQRDAGDRDVGYWDGGVAAGWGKMREFQAKEMASAEALEADQAHASKDLRPGHWARAEWTRRGQGRR